MTKKRPRGRPYSPRHMENYLSNDAEVTRLQEIHEEIAGTGAGRKHKVEVLNKSGIVLWIACWEAYVEDLAAAAFDIMLAKAKEPGTFPSKVLAQAARALKDAKDARRIWDLAGTGWKNVMKAHRSDILKRYTGRLNTPRPDQVDELFNSLIGLPRLSTKWRWSKCSSRQARKQLDDFVTLRGSIAHRVTAASSVHKREVIRCGRLITRLAVTSHNAVNSHMDARIGYAPWHEYEQTGS